MDDKLCGGHQGPSYASNSRMLVSGWANGKPQFAKDPEGYDVVVCWWLPGGRLRHLTVPVRDWLEGIHEFELSRGGE